MVLLPKPGRSPDSPFAYRPVCLLYRAGKLLERAVATRLETHLSRNVLGLHDSQFGFRRGRSTADAVARVRSLVEGAEQRGYVALAVSQDVVNAFNSIAWTGYARPSRFIEYPSICGVWSGHFSGTEASSTPSLAGG